MWKRLLVVAAGLALFVLVLTHIQFQKTLDILKNTNVWLCLLALVAFVAMTYLRGIRWAYLLKMQGYAYSYWDAFLVYMVSMFWGNVTPGRVGDFAKILYLKQDLKMPVGFGMASVLVDRVLDLYLLLVLGGLGILLNPMPQDPDSVKMVLAVKVFFVLLLVVTLLAFNKRIGGGLLKAAFQRMMKQEHREKTDQAFEDFHKGMAAFYKPGILAPFLLSLAAYVVAFWACLIMAQSIGIPIGLFYLVFCISVMNIVSLLTFLGLGTRDVALIKLFGLIGIKAETAEAYSLLIFFFGVILYTILCFLCTLLKPLRFKDS